MSLSKQYTIKKPSADYASLLKVARDRFKTLMQNAPTQAETRFLHLQTALESFMYSMDLQMVKNVKEEDVLNLETSVEAVPLRTFICNLNITLVDFLVKKTDLYSIEDSLEFELIEEVTIQFGGDIHYYKNVSGENKLAKVLTKMGATLYLNHHAQQEAAYRALQSVSWKDNEPITEFIKTLAKVFSRADTLSVLTRFTDKTLLFKEKIKHQRTENPVLFAGLAILNNLETDNITAYMNKFAEVVLQKYPSGVVPPDEVQVQSMMTNVTKPCRWCGDHHKDRQCPALGKECTYCGILNHLEKVCQKRLLDIKNGNTANKKVKSTDVFPIANLTQSTENFNPFGFLTCLQTFCHDDFSSKHMAGVDSCCNVFIFNDKSFFKTLTYKDLSLNQTDGTGNIRGEGIAQFKLNHSNSPTFTVNAFFVPTSKFHLFPHFDLPSLGLIPSLLPYNAQLNFKKQFTVPIHFYEKLSLVEIHPSTSIPTSQLTTLQKNELLHRKILHLNHFHDDNCDICKSFKLFKYKAETDTDQSLKATKPGEILYMDLLLPPKQKTYYLSIVGIIVVVDKFTRMLFTQFIPDFSAKTLTKAFNQLLLDHQLTPKILVTDRQSAFESTIFKDNLLQRKTQLFYAPRDRHETFNGLAERAIRSLKQMASCALADAQLPTKKFWPFAVSHAAKVKNLIPHRELKMSPWQKQTGNVPKPEQLFVFGSLTYVRRSERQDKFSPRTRQGVFLGYSQIDRGKTLVIYFPDTDKINRHLTTDVLVDETKNYETYLQTSKLVSSHHQKHNTPLLEESESETEETFVLAFPSVTKTQSSAVSKTSKNASAHTTPTTENTETENESVTSVIHEDKEKNESSSCSSSSHTQENEQIITEVENVVSQTQENEQVLSETKANEKGCSEAESDDDPVPIKVPYTTKGGRQTYRHNYPANRSMFTAITYENVHHKPRRKTPGQLRKLRKKILSSDPSIYKDILGHPEEKHYKEAVEKELKALNDFHTFKKVRKTEVPSQAEIGKLVILVTKKRSGRYKARCVFNGSKQKFRITSNPSSPTVSPETLMITLAVAACLGFHWRSKDVENAFLYASLPEGVKIYAHIPQGHPDYEPDSKYVFQIERSLYGIIEAPSLFFEHFTSALKSKTQLKQSSFDPCLWFEPGLLVVFYVDDILCLGTLPKIKDFDQKLGKEYKLTNSEINANIDFLGIQITREQSRFALCQTNHIDKVYKKYSYLLPNNRLVSQPLPHRQKLEPVLKPMEDLFEEKKKLGQVNIPFRELLGSLSYLRLTRPDLLYALHKLSKIAHSPGDEGRRAILHLLRYVHQTKERKRYFYFNTEEKKHPITLIGFSDADWATSYLDKRSTGGNFIYLGQNLISGVSKTQVNVAPTSTDAELIEIYNATKKLLSIHSLITEMKCLTVNMPILLTDSLTCIKKFKKPPKEQEKLYGVMISWIKEKIKHKEIDVLYIPRQINVADLTTNQANDGSFKRLSELLYSPFNYKHQLLDTPKSCSLNQKREKYS